MPKYSASTCAMRFVNNKVEIEHIVIILSADDIDTAIQMLDDDSSDSWPISDGWKHEGISMVEVK